MVNERCHKRSGRLCFLVRLNDLEHEPVTVLQMTGGVPTEKVHAAPPNFKGKTLPDRIVDDGLNGPMKGAIVDIKPNLIGPTTPVRILMTQCTKHPPNMSRQEAGEANKLADTSGRRKLR